MGLPRIYVQNLNIFISPQCRLEMSHHSEIQVGLNYRFGGFGGM